MIKAKKIIENPKTSAKNLFNKKALAIDITAPVLQLLPVEKQKHVYRTSLNSCLYNYSN